MINYKCLLILSVVMSCAHSTKSFKYSCLNSVIDSIVVSYSNPYHEHRKIFRYSDGEICVFSDSISNNEPRHIADEKSINYFVNCVDSFFVSKSSPIEYGREPAEYSCILDYPKLEIEIFANGEPVKKDSMQIGSDEYDIEYTSNFLNFYEYLDSLANPKIIPYKDVEEKPKFDGRDIHEFVNWINREKRYPETNKEKGVHGRIFLSFIISDIGKVEDVRMLKGIDDELNKEAMRIVSSSPLWTPGKQSGQQVYVSVIIPIDF